jgi:hypothetical protein
MDHLCIGFDVILVDCLLLFFLWVVFTCVLICLELLLNGFASLIFIHRVFLFFMCPKSGDLPLEDVKNMAVIFKNI